MSLVETIGVQPTIASALQAASQRTGTDFDYLLKTAMRESSLDYQAKSRTSSALGLFQFTEQSWLGTMKKHGAELGLGAEAQAISQNGRGR
ncbi:transglycosylase SLT domain-containing protein [Parvibaculum sp.]|uniref:transglycosylase SLT domain-containing protein n=2 Tax=Parvibaculum sp. TaxID=2024848 RepID=UPI0032EE1B9C